MSKFRDRLPINYKEHGIADLTMGLYLKDASVDNIWNDTTQEPFEFADKYFGKRFMQELKEEAKEGFFYVMSLIKRFLDSYSDVDQYLEDAKSLDMNESVKYVMQVGKNIGFKPVLIERLSSCSIPQPGVSKVSDLLISPESFANLFTILPMEWSNMRKEFFMFSGGAKLYETLICRLIWITVHCIVDSVRFNFDCKVGKNQVFKSCGSQVAQAKKIEKPNGGLTLDAFFTIPQNMEIYVQTRLYHRSQLLPRLPRFKSAFHKLAVNSLTLDSMFPSAMCLILPPLAQEFFKNYASTMAGRLRIFATSGEFRYLVEKTLQFTHVPQILVNITESDEIHRKLGEVIILVAERILNLEEFPVFGAEWKPVFQDFTKETTAHALGVSEFLTMLENFNGTCRAKLLELMKDSPNAEALSFHARASIIRFVFWFCASIVRSIFHVKLRRDFSIMELKYDDYDFEIVNEQKWVEPEPEDTGEKSNEDPKSSESMEVTDEELEAARSLRAPSTLSSSNSAMVNPEFYDFYRKVENDPKLSDEWKETIRGMIFSNYHLVKEMERVEQRYQRLCTQ